MKETRITREAAGTPAAIVQCAQDDAEEHFQRMWSRMGRVSQERRQGVPVTELLG